VRLRSTHDREILRLALPALGALAAEPLYILVDTAIVGHLGRAQLAALGVAATALIVVGTFNFLQYGTTAQVARATGAGEDETARRLGAQALWLSLALGAVVALVVALLAGPIVSLIGAEGRSAELAETYLRIVAIGVPSAFVALGGQGFLRGVGDLRGPLVVLLAANVLNVVLEVVLVYGLDLGIRGSAWGTAFAQTCMGLALAVLVLRRVGPGLAGIVPGLARRLLSVGRFLFVRTGSLIAAFVICGAVAARAGDATVGAFQIGLQLWLFLALVMDAVAIAGQIIVGRELGAGAADRAYAASVRMVGLSTALGAVFMVILIALVDLLPRAFTSDAAVLAEAHRAWWFLALMQPLGGAVFALDGILIGAGDGPYLATSMVVALAATGIVLGLTLALDWGGPGVWAALTVLVVTRLALMGVRFRTRRWLVVGWS
jgi:putative MATE family efflux protein